MSRASDQAWRARKRALGALAAAAPLLWSCALGPPVRVRTPALPQAYDAPTASARPEDPARWWTLYHDAQLEALVTEALASAPDARLAEARLAEALQVRREALAAYDPQGGLTGGGSRTQTFPIGKSVGFQFGSQHINLSPSGGTYSDNGQFDVSWELDLFGRRAAARKRANADLAGQRFAYEASRASLAANVADQLFLARGLAIELEDARESARIAREIADVAGKKAERGLGAESDADQARSEAAQAEAEAAEFEAQLHAARRTLLVLVGRGVDPLDGAPVAAEAEDPPPPPALVPADLLARRPDVREAAAAVTSAAGTLKLDELALFPKFTLTPGVGINNGNSIGVPITSDFWTIGASVAQPILDLPRLEHEIRAQGARVDAAGVTYEKTVQTAYGEAESALVSLDAAERRSALLTPAEADARRAYDAARKRYTAGVDDLTGVLSAERSWRSARSALTSARVDALRRSVQAFKALGGGWTPGPVTGAGRTGG